MKKIGLFLLVIMVAFSMLGCSNNDSGKDVDIKEISSQIEKKFGQDMPSLMELDDETLLNLYGISSELLDNYVAKVPLMNVHATEIFIAKVKDNKIDEVREGISKHKADLEDTWSRYLPAQYELVKNSKIVENGNYILFVVSEKADDIVKIFEDSFK